LPAANRRWIVVNALLVTAIVNLVVNGGVAWLSIRGQDEVPLWARPFSETSTLGDTLGTLFVLPLITTLLCTTAVWHARRQAELSLLPRVPPYERWLERMPSSRLVRGLSFGALAFAFYAPAVALALVVIDPGPLSQAQFVAFKTAFAVALGAIVTPQIALCAMTDRVSA